MQVIGIVAEYNPFHRGHMWHIAETRRAHGDCAIVCVMSGHWVQRGECAAADKWSRAAAALAGGADLVLDLPTPWATSSAEGFARGAVGLLAATGVVDTLSFGSEDGALDTLRALAGCMDSDDYRAALRAQLDAGHSFAAARERAARTCVGGAARALRTPNNNLAVEYLRALPPGMDAFTVVRRGAAHDALDLHEFASASAIRALLRAGEAARAGELLPAPWQGEIADLRHSERAILAFLRSLTPEGFDTLDGSGEGLGARLMSASHKARSLEEVYALTKSKRYAHARIRRMVLRAYLGIAEPDRDALPPYLRVLGMTVRGRGVLRSVAKKSALPVLTKPAHVRALGEQAQALFVAESRATDLFGLCFETPWPCGREWTSGPVVIR